MGEVETVAGVSRGIEVNSDDRKEQTEEGGSREERGAAEEGGPCRSRRIAPRWKGRRSRVDKEDKGRWEEVRKKTGVITAVHRGSNGLKIQV